jgi:hypothetical protein
MANPVPQADQAAAFTALEVVNNNDFTIEDRFDGVPKRFPPGEVVPCSQAECLHYFGWPGELEERAQHMARRFGWAGRDYLKPEGPSDDVPKYVKMCEKIVITPVYFDLVKRHPNDPIPVDTGDEESDRPQATAPEDTTKVGRRRRLKAPAKAKRDRHAVGDRSGVRLGAR